MRLGWAFLASVIPLSAFAFPVHVTKGPVITGVTQSDGWIAWETSSPEGTGSGCLLRGVAGFKITPAIDGQEKFRDLVCSRVHHVHLTGLRPGTRYSFVLRDNAGEGKPAGGHFSTAPGDAKSPFSFVVYGDNRDAAEPQPQTRGNHEAVASALQRAEGDVSFLLQTGDLALNTDIAGPDRGYQEFFDVERALLAIHPIFAVLGNHEMIDLTEYDALVNPAAFAKREHPYYGSFDWARAHFALIDAFEGPAASPSKPESTVGISPEQAQWLAADLEDASKRGQLLFLVSHQSPFSHVAPGAHGHGSSPVVASVVVPLMLKYHVLAIFAGHDHYYQRGHEGCIDYFVVGGGGAPMYEPDPTFPGVAVAKKTTSYVRVDVDQTGVTAIAKSTAGDILDTYKLTPADSTLCAAAAPPR